MGQLLRHFPVAQEIDGGSLQVVAYPTRADCEPTFHACERRRVRGSDSEPQIWTVRLRERADDKPVLELAGNGEGRGPYEPEVLVFDDEHMWGLPKQAVQCLGSGGR